MAFSTLDQLRASLNTELGISTDGSTAPFGSTSDRNRYIQTAIRKMWPKMARLVRESVTIVDNQLDYTLTGIRDIVRIDVLDTDGVVKDEIRSWDLVVDESATPIVRRLLIPSMSSTVSLRVLGYQPYAVPATGSDTCDIPSELEHVAITGARAEAFRPRVLAYIDNPTRAAGNPITSTSTNELLQLYFAAVQDFEKLLTENQRNMTAAKRARRTVR